MLYKYATVILTFLMLLATISAKSQTATNSDSTISQIPNLTMETVKGEQVQVGEEQHQATTIFLLSKPSSMSRGKILIKHIRLWIEAITSKYKGCVSSLLIVQPFKTSFPFYQIQKGKLKDESFPVILDKEGEVLDEFGVEVQNELTVVITKGNRGMMLPISVEQNGQNKKGFINKLDKLPLRSMKDNRCKDS